MRRAPGLILLLALLLIGCTARADVTAVELSPLLERDGIAFDDSSIPSEVIDRLAGNDVVLLGETHHLREHWAFVADLIGELHEHGFRLLLLEAPHMAGWLFDDYVQGGVVAPWWEPPPFYERRLEPIRMLNAELEPGERIHVRAIDINGDFYGGAADFALLFGLILADVPTPEAVQAALGGDYVDAEAVLQSERIERLLALLREDRSDLVESWGSDRYDLVVAMVEVELDSIEIRADDGEAASKAREEVMKRLADDFITACSCRTLINVGAHHAQKSHLMGTEQQWLGDYLTHESSVVDGSIIVVGLASAHTVLEPGAGGTPWDILDSTSPDNEIFRMMAEMWPERTVFLPLDDPLFADRRVAYNSEDVVYAPRLTEQFDAIIQYGLAHRMPEL